MPLFNVEHQAMKAYWGSEGIAPRILHPGTTWRLGLSRTLHSLQRNLV